jgi:hypothetical protein
MVLNNLVALFACITYATTSSIDFGVLVCVVGFLDPSIDDPISCTDMLLAQIQMAIPLQILTY